MLPSLTRFLRVFSCCPSRTLGRRFAFLDLPRVAFELALCGQGRLCALDFFVTAVFTSPIARSNGRFTRRSSRVLALRKMFEAFASGISISQSFAFRQCLSVLLARWAIGGRLPMLFEPPVRGLQRRECMLSHACECHVEAESSMMSRVPQYASSMAYPPAVLTIMWV